ncbi:inactive pancreatic lipase-related protein 1-like [Ptychodera flava]|uniref:inactive pancreatic lipase-related protein 1-like n=1 Tax=Ptychodera flava TaxID=63121 RepID=UPI003969BBDA
MSFTFFTLAVILSLSDTVLADTVCYDDLGCFTNAYPYNNTNFLPHDPASVNTRFGLYTKLNRDQMQVIDRSDPSTLHNSLFDKRRDTKFLIHGWISNWNTPWVLEMKDAFLNSTEDLNVIAVDWGSGAWTIYPQAVANTQMVGAEVDAFIRFLDIEYGEYHHDRVHLIGHSLGAQCSGHAGERMPTIGRISGLDPAGLYFEDEHPAVRLDPTDAKFVDVLHTDANLDSSGAGIIMECGHADFYPNGGENQPGCVGEDADNCDHARACEFYIESVNSDCKFLSCGPCERGEWVTCNTCNPVCNYMGYHAVPDSHGVFYLETNAEYPFCM